MSHSLIPESALRQIFPGWTVLSTVMGPGGRQRVFLELDLEALASLTHPEELRERISSRPDVALEALRYRPPGIVGPHAQRFKMRGRRQ